MKFKDALAAVDRFYAAIGRPRNIEGEKMVVSEGLRSTSLRPKQGGVYFAPTDEILRRHGGYKTYREMMHDDQVKACLEFKKILIAGRTWEIKEKADDPKSKEIAEFVTHCLQRMDFAQAIEGSLTALEFGYSLGEIVWERKEYEGKQIVGIKKIAHRDPETLTLAYDDHGNFTGVLQRNNINGRDIPVTPDKLWLYSHNARFGNIYGVSDLRAAYRSWWAKKFIINFWNVFLERMGAPMMMMKYPQGAGEDLQRTLVDILTNLSSKTEVLVPEGVEVDLIEATRSGTATYEEALNWHDKAISRALLMVALLGTGGEESKTQGSASQSSIHLRILFKMADKISQALTNSFMKQVIEPLVAMNFDDYEDHMPTFVWQDYGQFEGMKIADTIRLLHAAGILDLDQADVNYCRSVLGLPLRLEGDAEDKVQRPPPPPPPGNPNAPPPKAGQGNERAKKGGDTSTPTKNSASVDFSAAIHGIDDALIDKMKTAFQTWLAAKPAKKADQQMALVIKEVELDETPDTNE